ncbi:Nucleolar protein 14 [Fasciolopsis buskii]|uniref:Nucleolar protein 14 n=1 Tax=Fasciolopsis buskii TaxID=27845 RepID=A0A8E0RXJ5_9TREM|nr:Nucleolar protein 14 [Fasciolopsis buski]
MGALCKGHLFRILLQMPEHRNAVLIFLTDILATLRPQRLKQVVHLLWLVQVVLEDCEKRFVQEQYTHTVLNSQTSGSGAYCPELVQALTALVELTRSSTLTMTESGSQLDIVSTSNWLYFFLTLDDINSFTRLDARRSKNTDPRRSVQRKLTREKRGAMREMRRDSLFLAAHQLKMTKLK